MNRSTAGRMLRRTWSQTSSLQRARLQVPSRQLQSPPNFRISPFNPSIASRTFPGSRFISSARSHSTTTSNTGERPLTDRNNGPTSPATTEADEIAARKAQEPAYEMTFTCRRCLTRSTHRVTKQAYHFGTTLITCPGCKNRHLISDNLKIFSDKGITIEDILREKGELLRKGRLGDDGTVEFYKEKAEKVTAPEAQESSAEGGAQQEMDLASERSLPKPPS